MRTLALVVLGLALSAAANAASWRSLAIDGSTEEAFAQSVKQMQEALPAHRRVALGLSLQDLWRSGVQDAKDQQREHTSAEYLAKLDGLGYKGVIALADPDGTKRYDRASKSIGEPIDPAAPRRWPASNSGFPGFGPVPGLIGTVQ